MMKSSRILKIVAVLLLIGCLLPSVSAKKETIKLRAVARGTIKDTRVAVRVAARVSEVECGYSGPAVIRLSFVLPDGTKISCKGRSKLRGTIDIHISPDTGKAQEISIEFNDQVIPLTYDIDKGKWVTENAEITVRGDIKVTLNLVWRFFTSSPGLDASLIVQE